MAKFKKNFWRERSVTTEEGKVVDIPEPEWYSKQYDPLDRLGGYKGNDTLRPVGETIPYASVNGKLLPIKEAYEIYKKNTTDSCTLKFAHFKIALLKGTILRIVSGNISKPKG
jgi:hypothetical protein